MYKPLPPKSTLGLPGPDIGIGDNRATADGDVDRASPLVEEMLRHDQVAPARVTRSYYRQIRRSGCFEQLKRIIEPSPKEFWSPGQWDTGGEHNQTVVTGLQHKFPTTALLLATDRCFSYCRFCFRKRFVGTTSDEIVVDYPAVAAYIMQHGEISNVLISGGDPFTLDTDELHRILDCLLPIPHVTSIRFGTKALVFCPQRFRDKKLPSLFERIREAGKTPAIVTHIDHVGEISLETEARLEELRAAGVQFFNQAVLLNEVNDDAGILADTFRKLHALGVRPYYLFQARPVRQASHFQVPLRRGIEIVRGVNRRLNGIEKSFRYIMSHHTGKIEILDLVEDNRLYMRYHQHADAEQIGKVFWRPYREGACWLDE
jgi:KamA family protein